MAGSVYDISSTIISPEGRIFQVEYAQKAVDTSETIIGVKCKDGVVIASEKLLHSVLLQDGTNNRVNHVEAHVGMVYNGRIPDGRHLVNRARVETQEYSKVYNVPMTGKLVANRLSLYMHAHSLYGQYRPFGSGVIMASCDAGKYQLFMLTPSGECLGYHACAAGRGRQLAKTELERKDFKNLTCREALVPISKILHLCHEEIKDKPFQVEIGWICQESSNIHRVVPKDLVAEAEKLALEEIERDEMGEE